MPRCNTTWPIEEREDEDGCWSSSLMHRCNQEDGHDGDCECDCGTYP